MEKSDQKKVEYMTEKLWIDTRLTEKEMNFLRNTISEENKESFSNELAGNISKSEQIKDKDNWFYETVLKKLTENMFCQNWDAYRRYIIDQEEPLPKFKLEPFWVNYQKQHEFNPPHNHIGLYSFVIFMKIPTHWKEQHALPFVVHSNSPHASDFAFVRSRKDSETIVVFNFPLSPEDEGRMLFFPAWLQHMVFPFYGTEEERVTISGNIILNDSDGLRERQQRMFLPKNNTYEEKENMLKMMESSVKFIKEELKSLKKADEKEE